MAITEQDEINLRNVLIRYVHCIKMSFKLRDAEWLLRDASPSLRRRIEREGERVFLESCELAKLLAVNPLIKETAPRSAYEIKEDVLAEPDERRFFNPFLELMKNDEFNRGWYMKPDVEVVDYLMERLYEVYNRTAPSFSE